MDNSKDSVFIKLLKAHTNIDGNFIDTFFKKFKIGGELYFDIKDIDAANFLGISLITLKKRLTNPLANSSSINLVVLFNILGILGFPVLK
jgi:hypothetical protein